MNVDAGRWVTGARPYTWFAAALLVVSLSACDGTGAASCAGGGSPSASQTSSTPDTRPVVWRGARFTQKGWRIAWSRHEVLACFVMVQDPASFCDAVTAQDNLFVYASEFPVDDEKEPPQRAVLDPANMVEWPLETYPVDIDDDSVRQLTKGTAPIDGRTAYYGKWTMKTDDGFSFVGQRWLLPKSRLGLLALSSSGANAAAVYKLVETLDLSGFRPTKPNPRAR